MIRKNLSFYFLYLFAIYDSFLRTRMGGSLAKYKEEGDGTQVSCTQTRDFFQFNWLAPPFATYSCRTELEIFESALICFYGVGCMWF